jgi:hypothetical protein
VSDTAIHHLVEISVFPEAIYRGGDVISRTEVVVVVGPAVVRIEILRRVYLV